MDNAIGFPDTKLLNSGCLGWIASIQLMKKWDLIFLLTMVRIRSSNVKRKLYAEFLCILTSLINSVTALQANEIILF